MPKKRSEQNNISGEQIVFEPAIITRITNLLALLLVKGENQTEKIRALGAAGYQPAEIARLIGTTGNTVRVTLHMLRKKR